MRFQRENTSERGPTSGDAVAGAGRRLAGSASMFAGLTKPKKKLTGREKRAVKGAAAGATGVMSSAARAFMGGGGH